MNPSIKNKLTKGILYTITGLLLVAAGCIATAMVRNQMPSGDAIVVGKYCSNPITETAWEGGNYCTKVIPSAFNILVEYKKDTFCIPVDEHTYHNLKLSDKYNLFRANNYEQE